MDHGLNYLETSTLVFLIEKQLWLCWHPFVCQQTNKREANIHWRIRKIAKVTQLPETFRALVVVLVDSPFSPVNQGACMKKNIGDMTCTLISFCSKRIYVWLVLLNCRLSCYLINNLVLVIFFTFKNFPFLCYYGESGQLIVLKA